MEWLKILLLGTIIFLLGCMTKNKIFTDHEGFLRKDSAFLKWINMHRKQLATAVILILTFYFLWILNLGGIISFVTLYDIGFGVLTKKIGMNEWLARSILFPSAALFVYALKLMINLTSKDKRIGGTILMIALLTGMSVILFFYTKDRYTINDNFDFYTGEPLRRYAEIGDRVELYPKNILYHPTIGEEMKLFTKEKARELDKSKKRLKNVTGNKEIAQIEEAIEEPTYLFDKISGKSNFRYYRNGRSMDLFPLETLTHPTWGTNLSILTQEEMDKIRVAPRESPAKKFSAGPTKWTDTRYYVLKDDRLILVEGGPLIIRIGEDGIDKYIQSYNAINCDQDGRLFIKSANTETRSVGIENLSIRIFK